MTSSPHMVLCHHSSQIRSHQLYDIAGYVERVHVIPYQNDPESTMAFSQGETIEIINDSHCVEDSDVDDDDADE
jgi:hypothetical protein